MNTPSNSEIYLSIAIIFLAVGQLFGSGIKGSVFDKNNEPLMGATVVVQELQNKYAIVGIDGSFEIKNVPSGSYTLKINFIGYNEKLVPVKVGNEILHLPRIILEENSSMLKGVEVLGKMKRGTEAEARMIEKIAINTVNVVSSKAIELSPDITVANVIQRVSGLTIERNAVGDPQYAVVRGMDKRYNYTLVNGVKLPSPDNKNRYIPLDIFPANLLERLEVHKSLSADFEGDAIGGAINMVMKKAPSNFEIRGDFQSGYSLINLYRGFYTFDRGVINRQSPLDQYGEGYMAQTSDFTRGNLVTENLVPMPDFFGNISIGGRFMKNKMGVLAAASLQNSYRSTESVWFDYNLASDQDNLTPQLSKLQERYYSTQQMRNGYHVNWDYTLNKRNKLNLYTGYYQLNDAQVRELTEYRLGGGLTNPASGNSQGMKQTTRTRLTSQAILNSVLSGEHILDKDEKFAVQWSAVYSIATQKRPDNAQFNRVTEMVNFELSPERVYSDNPRRWERNSDRDYTGYLNFTYHPILTGKKGITLKAGGMYRTKDRSNFFNEYMFQPEYPTLERGKDWETYRDLSFRLINPLGTTTNPLNYDAREDILACYFMAKYHGGHWHINAGLRVENTEQGYTLRKPLTGQTPDSNQKYTDFLPSVQLRYELSENTSIRSSYYKAVSRPGFFEIVPFRLLDEDYNEVGNPMLRRVQADNYDIRYEYIPNAQDQVLVGLFYKRLTDPIEYGLVPFGAGNSIVLMPLNVADAVNWGLELNYMKFYNLWGIRANYTYTNSRLNAIKSRVVREDREDPTSQLITINQNEIRPLQGQARNVANLSLLYKDIKKGTDAQIAFTYTGERLEQVSPFYQNDSYALPMIVMDISAEQRLKKGINLFFRINNVLNTPYKVVVRGEPNLIYKDFKYQENIEKYTLIRRDFYRQMVRIGVRFEF